MNDTTILHTLYMSEIITRRFMTSLNYIIFSVKLEIPPFVDIPVTKPQSLTIYNKCCTAFQFWDTVWFTYVSLHSPHAQNNTCYYHDSAKS